MEAAPTRGGFHIPADEQFINTRVTLGLYAS